MNSALIIFVKNVEKGKVKTRLAKTVGDDQALKIYKALLDHTRTIAQSVSVDRFLFYNNSIVANEEWNETLTVMRNIAEQVVNFRPGWVEEKIPAA